MTTLTVRTEAIDLPGGQVLRVSSYTDPGTGSSALTLAKNWHEGADPIAGGDSVLTFQGEIRAELIEALEALGEAG